MTKSVKVKIILIITFLTLSALIMTYKYFTEFKQAQIDREEQEEQKVAWDSPINQFEFADPNTENTQEQQTQGTISKIDLSPQAFLQIQYSTQPFVNAPNAKEMAEKIATYGKDPAIQNFIKDMDNALSQEGVNFDSLPSVDEFKKQMASTQTQKILLQYSKDPAFKQAMQRIMQDPAFMTGFINYINQPEQESSK
ncbi:MAG: hypothetical protein IKP23_00130 [Elusimicrobiaceae bacterium]|nr:hypothetical protein [Elusimicrobiaceae bacterium]